MRGPPEALIAPARIPRLAAFFRNPPGTMRISTHRPIAPSASPTHDAGPSSEPAFAHAANRAQHEDPATGAPIPHRLPNLRHRAPRGAPSGRSQASGAPRTQPNDRRRSEPELAPASKLAQALYNLRNTPHNPDVEAHLHALAKDMRGTHGFTGASLSKALYGLVAMPHTYGVEHIVQTLASKISPLPSLSRGELADALLGLCNKNSLGVAHVIGALMGKFNPHYGMSLGGVRADQVPSHLLAELTGTATAAQTGHINLTGYSAGVASFMVHNVLLTTPAPAVHIELDTSPRTANPKRPIDVAAAQAANSLGWSVHAHPAQPNGLIAQRPAVIVYPLAACPTLPG